MILKRLANKNCQILSERVKAELSTIKKKNPDEELEVFICAKRAKIRSVDYNAYYWGVVLKQISEYTGDDVQALHQWYKQKFAVTFTTAFGETIETTKETKKMTHKEFDEYVQMIRQHAEMIGVGYIPMPKEVPDYVLVEQVNSGLA